MTLNLCVLTPNRIVWDSEVKEIILSTNSGQIGVLANHAPKVFTFEVSPPHALRRQKTLL
jgi:F0F1-type ATP synthase epsilon subunit